MISYVDDNYGNDHGMEDEEEDLYNDETVGSGQSGSVRLTSMVSRVPSQTPTHTHTQTHTPPDDDVLDFL